MTRPQNVVAPPEAPLPDVTEPEVPVAEVPANGDPHDAANPLNVDGNGLLPAVATVGETEEAKTIRQSAIREAYGAAQKRLREENLSEFNRLHKEEAAKRGYDWSPKPTASEKALADLQRLLAEHPELAESLPKGEG